MRRWKFWSANGSNVAIVAVSGKNADWAAYIGALSGSSVTKEEVVEWVEKHGSKIGEYHARVLFPEFKNLRWRE